MATGDAAAPAAPAVKEYVSAVSTGAAAAPTSGPGIASHLDSLSATIDRAGGAGIASYLSSVPQNPTQLSGAGITAYLSTVATSPVRVGGAGIYSYLDSVSQACDAVAPDTTACAEAISDYMGALSTGDAP